jgi:hypothetical protein
VSQENAAKKKTRTAYFINKDRRKEGAEKAFQISLSATAAMYLSVCF